MRRQGTFNPKRSIDRNSCGATLEALASRVRYGGNPEHKRRPYDYGLVPPVQHRANKTLCDGADVSGKRKALGLLRRGVRQGLISRQKRRSFPQNIWCVSSDGRVFEAQLENAEMGVYHGYPMPEEDPMFDVVRTHGSER